MLTDRRGKCSIEMPESVQDKNQNNKSLKNGSRVEDGQFKEIDGFVLPKFKRFLQYTLIDRTEK